MLDQQQIEFLKEYGYSVSELKTKDVYWIYDKKGHCLVVKNSVYELFLQEPHLIHLATISVTLPLEDFIILMNAFHFINV